MMTKLRHGSHAFKALLSLAMGLSGLPALADYTPSTGKNVPDGICISGSAEKAALLCDVTDRGTIMEAYTGFNGEFPQIKSGRSHFIYQLKDDGLGASPSHLDIELPICDEINLETLLNRNLSGPGGVEVVWKEESSGVSFSPNRVLKLDAGVPSGGMKDYTIAFDSNAVNAEPVRFAIKTGDGVEFGGIGILGPGCGKPEQPEPADPKQRTYKRCQSQVAVGSGDNASYESYFNSRIENKGNVPLYDPMIQEFNTNLSCEITAVNELPVEPPVPIPNSDGSYVNIPTNANFDGILDPADAASSTKGERVNFEIRCEHDEPNLINTLKSKVATVDGILQRTTRSNMERQCPVKMELVVDILKTCDGVSPGERLMAMDGHLVVEICPRIRVTNKGAGTLFNVTVTDTKVDGLESGLDIGTLAPDETIDLSRDLGIDTCYMPSKPNEPAIGDHGTPDDPSDDKYDPEKATFTNTATVVARGANGGETSDSDSSTCSLADQGVPDSN